MSAIESSVASAPGALPLVSVGLPTFNRAKTLKRAIDSVLGQDYRNLELIVSDNCSTDDTEALCNRYRASDARLKYVRQSENRGAYDNFMAAFAASHGNLFMWLGDDDWLGDSYLSHCAAVLSSRPDVALACGVPKYYNGELLAFEGVSMNLLAESPVERVATFYARVSDNGTFYGLMRRASVVAVPPAKVLGNDWLFVGAVALQGKIVTVPDVIVNRDSDGISANLESLARGVGLSPEAARRPYQSIAANIIRDILFHSPTFATLSWGARLSLSLRILRILNRRFLVNEHPFWIWTNRMRFRLKLRTRFRQIFHLG